MVNLNTVDIISALATIDSSRVETTAFKVVRDSMLQKLRASFQGRRSRDPVLQGWDRLTLHEWRSWRSNYREPVSRLQRPR
jgi:hypothetical protein